MARSKKDCPKCGKHAYLTRHHILPKRHFGSRGPTIDICRECHDSLEVMISGAEYRENSGKRKKMRRHEYYRVLIQFMKGGKKHET